MLRVLLVDDHELIRHGLRRSFERADDFEVVGEAASAQQALDLASKLRPDVVVMDVRLPDGSGIEAAAKLRADSSTLGIVVLTMYAGDEQLFAALEAGASAFVPKDAPAEAVLSAARYAVNSPLSFSAADLAAAIARRMNPQTPRLSPREQDVLRLLAEGQAVASIGRTLYISESTAKSHISKIYEKLGAANRAQALMTALRLGLLQSPGGPSA